MRRVRNKSQAEIAREWDRIAELRSVQIRSGKDISYEHVLVPSILQLTEDCDRASVLDVGCGCGFLTSKLAISSERVIGIDLSSESIRIANKTCQDQANVIFLDREIETLGSEFGVNSFSLAVANMSLMTMLRLDAALTSLSCLVRPGGHLAFTITHPCFWPLHWNYPNEWYRYHEEIVIEAPFHISLDHSSHFTTTHIHRPLERYMEELSRAGFRMCRLLEPMPPPQIEAMYPTPWQYPRFLAALCIRVES